MPQGRPFANLEKYPVTTLAKHENFLIEEIDRTKINTHENGIRALVTSLKRKGIIPANAQFYTKREDAGVRCWRIK